MKHSWMRSTTAGWIIGLLALLVFRPLVDHGLRLGIEWWAERVWESTKPRLAQDLRTLDPVLHALEQYQIDHRTKGSFAGKYPPTLQDLVPGYLKAMPALPPTLRMLRYSTTQQRLMPPLYPNLSSDPNAYTSCEITIPLRSQSMWRQFLGIEPRGTLVYRGVRWSDMSGPSALWGRPTDRLAGWGYYPPRRVGVPSTKSTLADRHQEALLPYRKERLKAIKPVADALEEYWRDHVDRPDHPPTHPPSLQSLVPRYLPALPKLPIVFGPVHYENGRSAGWLWVRLNEQVIDQSGKPLDISGTFLYSTDGGVPDIILDQSDPSTRPYRPLWTKVGVWSVYD